MSRSRVISIVVVAAAGLAAGAALLLRQGPWQLPFLASSDRPLPPVETWPGWGVSPGIVQPWASDEGTNLSYDALTAPGEPLWIVVGSDSDSLRLYDLQRTPDGFGPARYRELPAPISGRAVALVAGGSSPVLATHGKRSGPPQAFDAFTGAPVPLELAPGSSHTWLPSAPGAAAWRFVSVDKGGGIGKYDPRLVGRYVVNYYPRRDSFSDDPALHWTTLDAPTLSGTIPLPGVEADRRSRWCATAEGGVTAIGPDFEIFPFPPLGQPKESDRVVMVFHQADPEAWLGPVEGKFSLSHFAAYAFHCEPGAGVLTAIGNGEATAPVERVRCTPQGCRHQSVRLTGPVRDRLALHDFGDRVLVLRVWASVRMRLAPFEALSTAPERVLFSLPHGGEDLVPGLVKGYIPTSVIADADAAIILLASPELRAMQITRAGRVAVIGTH